MDRETDSSSLLDNFESGYESIMDTVLAYNSTTTSGPTSTNFVEETCLMKIPENSSESCPTRLQDLTCSNVHVQKSSESVDLEYLKYVAYMPGHLKSDIIDVLIICGEKDTDDAETFKEFLIENFSCRAELLETSLADKKRIREIYNRTVLFFIFVTKTFCNKTDFKSHVFLNAILNDRADIDMVPVLTCSDSETDDMSLEVLIPIRHYRQDKDSKRIKNMLSSKQSEIINKKRELEDSRKEFYKTNKRTLIENHRQKSTNQTLPKERSIPNIPEINIKVNNDTLSNDDETKDQSTRKIYNIVIGNVNNMIIGDNGQIIRNTSSDVQERRDESICSTGNTVDGVGSSKDFCEHAPDYQAGDTLKIGLRLDEEKRLVDSVKGDGNCFFRALCKQMYDSDANHQEVRRFIVDIVATNKEKFAQFVDEEDVQSHVKRMSEDRCWATTCEIFAAATLLQRDIYLFTPNHSKDKYSWLLFKPLFERQVQEMKLLGCSSCYVTLCNTNGNHYDRIVPNHDSCNCFLPPPQTD